ncbi:MAG: transcriptional regulator [Candidatus Thorarchaeota archaeon]
MTKARTQLMQEVTSHLVEAGFDISSHCDVRPSCFDVVARKDDKIILIKTLANIDALKKDDAIVLQLVAQFFDAIPLIVGKTTRRGTLDDGVVYKRYGVPTIAPHSFERMIVEEQQPRQFIQRGGRFVSIDGEKLKEVRLSLNMTQEELADCIQVSARAVLAYEKNEMAVSVEAADKLERELKTDLIIPVDLLSSVAIPDEQPQTAASIENLDLAQRVKDFFEKLEMSVLWTDRAPFHVIAKEEGPPLMTGVGSIKSKALKKRVDILKSVSEVTESDAVLIVEEGKTEQAVSDLPVIRQLELEDIDEPHKLKKIINERSE